MKKILNGSNNSKKILSQDGVDYILDEGFNSDIKLNAKSKLIIKSNNYTGLITITNGVIICKNTAKEKNLLLLFTSIILIIIFYCVFFAIKKKYSSEYSYIYTVCVSFLFIIGTVYFLIAGKLTASSHLVGSVLFLCAILYGTMEFFDKIDNYDNQIINQQKIQNINNDFEYIADLYRKKISDKKEIKKITTDCKPFTAHTPEKIVSTNSSTLKDIKEIEIINSLRIARDSCTNHIINDLDLKYSYFNFAKNILLVIFIAFFVSVLASKVNVN